MKVTWVLDVIVAVPLKKTFHYLLPEDMREGDMGAAAWVGRRVAVEFGRRKMVGIVRGIFSETDHVAKLKPVSMVLDAKPLVTSELLRFVEEAALYYFTPLGEAIKTVLPLLLSEDAKSLKKSGFIEKVSEIKGTKVSSKKNTKSDDAEVHGDWNKTLTMREEQKTAVTRIRRSLVTKDKGRFLLYGVTGSGKTEVYLECIETCLQQGQSALVLVPEIALTPQLWDRFAYRLQVQGFSDQLAIIHSALSPKERAAHWYAIARGEKRVVMGARSALFAPIHSLGLLIVDEEHDASYKQEEGFRYHARDMALLRAHRAEAVCVLGSATPSLESFADKRNIQLSMRERGTGVSMPDLHLIDMRRYKPNENGFTHPMFEALKETLSQGEQALLFLNRRGYAGQVMCVSCGEGVKCPLCKVSLSEHHKRNVFACHYCEFECERFTSCKSCGEASLVRVGTGTERVEDALLDWLSREFPDVKVARLDRDVVQTKKLEQVLRAFRERKMGVLVGTQMIAKGHDLPHVTMAGVLSIDHAITLPDFRATEKTLQLLLQVAGRSGRGEKKGRVYIQTHQPDHMLFKYAVKHDYTGFLMHEHSIREETGFPPFGRLSLVRVDAFVQRLALETSASLTKQMADDIRRWGWNIQVLGPMPAPMFQLKGRFRYHILLRAIDRNKMHALLKIYVDKMERLPKQVRWSVDMDPVSLLN